jgi:predicted acetyltransferase
MLDPDLVAAKERGEPLGMLIAAEFPIYGRFGYGSAADHVQYDVDARTVRFVQPGSGTVELVDAPALRKEAPALYERWRRAQPGAIERNDNWWDTTLRITPAPGDEPFKGFLGLHRNEAGTPEGYIRYHTNGKWEGRRPNTTLEIDEMLAVTPNANARLWRYCCEVDWVAKVQAHDRNTDEAVLWMVSDGRHITQRWRSDFLWVRMLDVAAALSVRTYLTPGRIVIEVADAQGLAAGRFALDGGPDGASCAPTTESAGIAVSAEALGAAYLGGVSLRTLAGAGQVDAHDEQTLATADTMFRGAIAPWCTTWF